MRKIRIRSLPKTGMFFLNLLYEKELRLAFKRTRKIKSTVTRWEGRELYYAAKKAKNGIVEIGSFLGKSTIFLAAGSRAGNNVPVYCIDTWKDCDLDMGTNYYTPFLKNAKPYKNLIFPIIGKAEETAKRFKKEFDLVFIDGNHSFKAVKQDWKNYGRKAKTCFFHDTAYGYPACYFDLVGEKYYVNRPCPNLGKVFGKRDIEKDWILEKERFHKQR